jgi:NAD(P)-dependent dehydrogenase (short-subunit alcohol dehydrogenase family)
MARMLAWRLTGRPCSRKTPIKTGSRVSVCGRLRTYPEADLTAYMCMTVGPYLCSAAFVHLLAAAGTKGPVKRPGNIINISSLSGLTKWSQNGQFAYNVGYIQLDVVLTLASVPRLL